MGLNLIGADNTKVPDDNFTIFNLNLIVWAKASKDSLEIMLQGANSTIVIYKDDYLYDSHRKTLNNFRSQVILGAK